MEQDNRIMRVLRDTDLTGYATAVLPFLLRDPVVNNMPVWLIAGRRSGRVPVEPDGCWLRVESGGEVCGVALRTPPYGMLLTPMPPDAVAALADHLAADPGSRWTPAPPPACSTPTWPTRSATRSTNGSATGPCATPAA